MSEPDTRRGSRFGPAAIAIVGLFAIAVGAAVKTGYIKIGRDGPTVDSSLVNVRTGAGEVAMPATTPESVTTTQPSSASPAPKSPLAMDTLVAQLAAEDSNAVRPTSAELAELAAALVVPVAGIQPKDLLDTFAEPRGDNRRHNALDILAPRSTPVLAATDGRLLRLYTSEAGGLMVYASDPTDRFVLMYAHLDRYADGLADGMPLRRGDTIGYVGTTGNAPPTVPHLHFAIARTSNVARWWTGMPVDPRPLLRR